MLQMQKAISVFFGISFLMAMGYGVSLFLDKIPYYTEVSKSAILFVYYFVTGGCVFKVLLKIKES